MPVISTRAQWFSRLGKKGIGRRGLKTWVYSSNDKVYLRVVWQLDISANSCSIM